MNLLSFIDASGTFSPQDRFFGVGMMTIEKSGSISDALSLIFQRVLAISQAYRDNAVKSFIDKSNFEEAIKILKKTKRFELKFDRITPVKIELYKEMIRTYFSIPTNRFSAMVIDRQEPSYDDKFFPNTWEAYSSYVATMVMSELRNLQKDQLLVVVDDITKPRYATLSLEDTIFEKVRKKIDFHKEKELFGQIFNIIRVDSHSNLLLQLVDVLLGSVMFDFKKKNNLISEKLINRKEPVVACAREFLGVDTLAKDFTKHSPAYFSVWQPLWKEPK